MTSATEQAARQGLTAAEVAERRAQGQVNRTPRSDWADYRAIASRNLFTVFNAFVAPAAAALFLLAEYRGAWAVSALAVINSAIGLAQEIRAKWHLDRLAILVETRARVIRAGEEQQIPAGDIVLGDHVRLVSGDPVVADGTLLEARFLEIDEALLTGESDPVPRQRGDRLLSGSCCVAGEGVYRADQVGPHALAQQTALAARRYQFSASPLQRTIDRLIQLLTATAVALCLLEVGLYFLRGFSERDLVAMIAATVTSMVPQGLVLTTTLALSLGAVRLSSRGAIVQQLPAVESMAAVTVLCMDKTGTLTTNRLCLDRLHLLDTTLAEAEVRARLQLLVMTSLDRHNKSIQALRAALGEAIVAVEVIDQVPFKSQNRYSAVRVRVEAVDRVLVLGAFEALRPFLEDAARTTSDTAWRDLLPTGLRLLLFAEAAGAADWPPLQGSLNGLQLRPLALVALSDELRPDAGVVLAALAAQGIALKILSGDHPETVRATIAHLRLPLSDEPIVSGDELASAGMHLIAQRNVFGRLAPRQKIEIVAALQARGHHVAMLGDGINDLLCIKRADLGIAMGEGSAATRTVAGLVLENNSFALLPAALDEGRTILRNLRRAAKLFLLKNVYSLFLIVMALGVFGLDFPYLPQQVTLLNALTIGIPALIITLSHAPSAAPSRSGFLREVGWFVLPTGLVIGSAGLAVWLLAARWLGADLRMQRTMLLTTLVLLGLASLWRVLTHSEAQPLTSDRWLRWLTLAALPVYGLALYVPPLADFFQLEPLRPAAWGLVLAVVIPAFLACKAVDWWMTRAK